MRRKSMPDDTTIVFGIPLPSVDPLCTDQERPGPLWARHRHVGPRPESIDPVSARPGEHIMSSARRSFRLYPRFHIVAVLRFRRLSRSAAQVHRHEGSYFNSTVNSIGTWPLTGVKDDTFNAILNRSQAVPAAP